MNVPALLHSQYSLYAYSDFPHLLSYRSLWVAICSLVALVITLRSAAVVVMGFTQVQAVSTNSVVLLQPALKIIVSISSDLNFNMGSILGGLGRLFVLDGGLFNFCLHSTFSFPAGLADRVAGEATKQRGNCGNEQADDCGDAHEATPPAAM